MCVCVCWEWVDLTCQVQKRLLHTQTQSESLPALREGPAETVLQKNCFWSWGVSLPQLIQMVRAHLFDLSAPGTVSSALTWSFPRISKGWLTIWLTTEHTRKIPDNVNPLPPRSLFWGVYIFSGERCFCANRHSRQQARNLKLTGDQSCPKAKRWV